MHFSKSVPDYTVSKDELDLGVITFDIDANLTEVFNWNVKQLFLYLAAEYETKTNKVNQVSYPRAYVLCCMIETCGILRHLKVYYIHLHPLPISPSTGCSMG